MRGLPEIEESEIVNSKDRLPRHKTAKVHSLCSSLGLLTLHWTQNCKNKNVLKLDGLARLVAQLAKINPFKIHHFISPYLLSQPCNEYKIDLRSHKYHNINLKCPSAFLP